MHSLSVDTTPSQPQSSAEQSKANVHGSAVSGSPTPSGEQAIHISSQSPTVPNQPELYSEGRQTEGRKEESLLTDSKTTPSGKQALHISSPSPSVPNQPELYSEGRLIEGRKEGSPLTDSKTTPGEQALHISSQLSTVPNQPELYSEGRQTEGRKEGSLLTDSKTTPSGARALLDVLSTPDMSDVDELVVTEVAANWQRVALRLGVEGCVSEAVLKNHPNDHEGACQDMLDRWLRRDPHTGEEKRTWSTLLIALGRAGFEELERTLRRKHFHKAISP